MTPRVSDSIAFCFGKSLYIPVFSGDVFLLRPSGIIGLTTYTLSYLPCIPALFGGKKVSFNISLCNKFNYSATCLYFICTFLGEIYEPLSYFLSSFLK